jgi:hypothetical protein
MESARAQAAGYAEQDAVRVAKALGKSKKKKKQKARVAE